MLMFPFSFLQIAKTGSLLIIWPVTNVWRSSITPRKLGLKGNRCFTKRGGWSCSYKSIRSNWRKSRKRMCALWRLSKKKIWSWKANWKNTSRNLVPCPVVMKNLDFFSCLKISFRLFWRVSLNVLERNLWWIQENWCMFEQFCGLYF